VRIEYVDLTPEEFAKRIDAYETSLRDMFTQSRELEGDIAESLGGLRHE